MEYYGSDEEEERSEEYKEEEMYWCSTCSRDLDAKVFCVDCLLSLCVPCREAHDIIPVTKGHQIIPVEDFDLYLTFNDPLILVLFYHHLPDRGEN